MALHSEIVYMQRKKGSAEKIPNIMYAADISYYGA